MKLLLAALLCLLTFTSAHAQAWPRNPKTGKVEFRGALPWPASAKTEAQRRALVRRWYLAKLTDFTPAGVEERAASDRNSRFLITYAGLPKVTSLKEGEGVDAYLLGYHVELTPTTSRLKYALTGFELERLGDVESTSNVPPLDQLLPKANPNEQAALAALRKRLAVALAGW
ncbi:MAG: hypothetical protein ACRYFZ_18885 [Janthinobacterium lividum]